MSKVAVITGCTSGIGKELCALYRADGYEVVGMARTAVAPDIAVDVTDCDAVKAAVDEAAARYGHIDVAIACAGAGLSGATELLPINEVKHQTELCYTGALWFADCVLKHMGRGGKLIFISSACAIFALPYRATYCASKAAVNMAAHGLYMELKPHGIRVTAVCPGDIKTGFTANRVKYSDGGERYGGAPKASADKIDGREVKRMALKPAAKKIYKCCVKCRKPLYIVGAKYKFLDFLRRVLPRKFFLDVTAKLF